MPMLSLVSIWRNKHVISFRWMALLKLINFLLLQLVSIATYGHTGLISDYLQHPDTLPSPSIKKLQFPDVSDTYIQPSSDNEQTTKFSFVTTGEHSFDISLNFTLRGNQLSNSQLISNSDYCFETTTNSLQCLMPPEGRALSFVAQGNLSDNRLSVTSSTFLPAPWVLLVEVQSPGSQPTWLLTDGGITVKEAGSSRIPEQDESITNILKTLQNQDNQELQAHWEKSFTDRLQNNQNKRAKEPYLQGQYHLSQNDEKGPQHPESELKVRGHVPHEHKAPTGLSSASPLELLLELKGLRDSIPELDLSANNSDMIFIYIPDKKRLSSQKKNTVTDDTGSDKNTSGQQPDTRTTSKSTETTSTKTASTKTASTGTAAISGQSWLSYFQPHNPFSDLAIHNEHTLVIAPPPDQKNEPLPPSPVRHPTAPLIKTQCPLRDSALPIQGCWIRNDPKTDVPHSRIVVQCRWINKKEGNAACSVWVGEVLRDQDKGPCLDCEKHLGESPELDGLVLAPYLKTTRYSNFFSGKSFRLSKDKSTNGFYTTFLQKVDNQLVVDQTRSFTITPPWIHSPYRERWYPDDSGLPIWKNVKKPTYLKRFE